MQHLLDQMCRRVLRHGGGDPAPGLASPDVGLPGVSFGIARQGHHSVMTLYQPMACLVLRGAKEVTIGDRVLRYDPATCFVASLDLPAAGCVIEACESEPYIVASLALDSDLLSELLADLPPAPEAMPAAGFGVAPVTLSLLEAWDHLLALIDRPADIAFLARSRQREVLYQFLQGAHGPMLRQLVREDSRLAQVRRALLWIRDHYDQMIRTETLAGLAGMSVPTFHRHFKAVTAMSPLQYQKALRLQAARRMLATSGDATRVAYAVGYESPSQFSREYARLFGAPPLRDAARLRGGRAEAGAIA
ncbi:AraC family transcriptional regulator [Rhizobium rhizosphaerae]|uniref:AraC family transcriptional regulator n=1 Tax=Xaviernesmea rhizosphaerae TaxID=1672749 RepID=A0ABX3PFT9_9HYPH|nr:AraC family transcriptional regulator [Xaviernesmea rhizosphaerae]OQP87282.1 AraC family transcriptional regulator [Xaviernesmea rhizosphaerae]